MESFGKFLTAEFGDLKHWLETRFDRLGQQLEGIADTQKTHTGLLQTILTEIGGFPALWRSNRWFRYGAISFAVLVLAGLGFIVYQNQHLPEQTAAAVQHSFDAKLVATRLRTEIEDRFQQDKAKAIAAGQHWDALRELEKQRDTTLSKVDDVISTIEQGLAGKPDPVFVEASRILQTEGTDAALGYLDSHKAERRARVELHKASAEAAEEKLRQDAQALFLEAELQQTRYQWEPALAALREAVDIAPRWWLTRWLLGELLKEMAKYAEAQPHLQAAMALADNDIDRAIAITELALLYNEQDHWAEAEPLYRQALSMSEKSYGPEHPEVATDLNNLAQLLQETNRLAEAEPLTRRALAIDEKSYGAEHPKVATVINNLASLMYATNRLAEAEPLLKRALAIDEKSYGPEHPKVANALNNLASLMYATNRLAEAEPLLKRALAIDEKSYGPEHPKVANALNNLAQLFKTTNRLTEAEPLQRRAVVILLKSTHAAGHELPNLRQAFANYQALLTALHLKPAALNQRLDSLGPEAGYSQEEWQRLRGQLSQN